MSVILVVDDSELYRTYLQEELRQAGHDVETATCGEEALEKVKTRVPDLVLLDVMMGGMDGFEVCRHCRARPEMADVPIVLVTSRDSPEDTVRGLDVGASDYISKPFNREILLARVRTQLHLKENADELKRLNQLKDEVLSIASHDLKGPISSILCLVGILSDASSDPLTPYQKRSVENINETAFHMLSLVNDVLDIAKMEAGRMEIYPVEVQLAHIVAVCVERNQFMAHRKNVQIEVKLPADLPTIVADPQKLNQVVNNLLNNAIKFSPEGGSVTIAANAECDRLLLWIEDRGPGIPESERERLFQKFSQTSVRASGGERGTGLGLAIVKQIVELHGGTVWVVSQVGEGSRFGFAIPKKGEAFAPVSQ